MLLCVPLHITNHLVYQLNTQYHAQNFVPVFFSPGYALPEVSFRLIWCPPNLHVAFNEIISEVQGGKAAGRSAAYEP